MCIGIDFSVNIIRYIPVQQLYNTQLQSVIMTIERLQGRIQGWWEN